jgi:hypothetical protein
MGTLDPNPRPEPKLSQPRAPTFTKASDRGRSALTVKKMVTLRIDVGVFILICDLTEVVIGEGAIRERGRRRRVMRR